MFERFLACRACFRCGPGLGHSKTLGLSALSQSWTEPLRFQGQVPGSGYKKSSMLLKDPLIHRRNCGGFWLGPKMSSDLNNLTGDSSVKRTFSQKSWFLSSLVEIFDIKFIGDHFKSVTRVIKCYNLSNRWAAQQTKCLRFKEGIVLLLYLILSVLVKFLLNMPKPCLTTTPRLS